ncbi:MAG TPA: ribosome maturation factor RimM [Terriglobales bacterium]|nr:ribosome maturation factor RimM [Terriglobales bacterium]
MAESDFVTVARVVRSQGRRGEVAAELLTDFPERFAERRKLFVADASGRRELELEAHWLHKGRVVLKFRGVDSIEQAQALAGCELQIPREERAPLPQDAAYVSDLIGCEVLDRGHSLGVIAEVQFGAGEAPLLQVKSEAGEHLIPFAAEFVENVDVELRRVALRLPPGMLEIGAPLTDEEKRAQRDAGRAGDWSGRTK